jgi:hypothetical protein
VWGQAPSPAQGCAAAPLRDAQFPSVSSRDKNREAEESQHYPG